MTSKQRKIRFQRKSGFGMDVPIAPKTKHEEIMNCIESTNDIVSKILEIELKKDGDRERLLKYLESDKK